jgi:dienelactone hydrolase
MKEVTQIGAYEKEVFSCKMRNGKIATHDVYTRGSGKKMVVIIQELPGIGQETLHLADLFIAKDYTVVMPHLFGPIGRTASVRNMAKVCISREFKVFAKNESSPIVDFLSGLCSSLKEKHQVKGVAVIGMCLTGNFAISLMANENVLAGFASQPSMPFFSQKSLHMSSDEVTAVKENLDVVGAMHCGRFEKDWICKNKKIEALRNTFNENGKERMIFHELPGRGHSILTLDFVDKDTKHPTQKVLKKVLEYFDEQLED